MGRGRQVEIPGHATDPANRNLQADLVVEVYDEFPNVAFTTVQYKNTGADEIKLDQVIAQRHRFNSHEVKAAPYEMWSFQGASREWGEDEMLKLKPGFSRHNDLGAMVKGGYGGGIPVIKALKEALARLADSQCARGHMPDAIRTLSEHAALCREIGDPPSFVPPTPRALARGVSFCVPRGQARPCPSRRRKRSREGRDSPSEHGDLGR